MTNNNELQNFISKVCEQYWFKEVLLIDNLLDVPDEYKRLLMLVNALKSIKTKYEIENKDYLEAFRYFSYKHRKEKNSTWDFLSRFENYRNTKNSQDLVLY